MAIKLKLEGFDDLLKEIEKAGGSIKSSTETCMQNSAQIMQHELKAEMQKSHVEKDLIDRLPAPSFENDFGLITARVGYRKGAYNPKKLSDGYKIVFINYGTPYRRKHGKIRGKKVRLGFIQRAKNRARPKIKKEQEKTLKEILKGLE